MTPDENLTRVIDMCYLALQRQQLKLPDTATRELLRATSNQLLLIASVIDMEEMPQ